MSTKPITYSGAGRYKNRPVFLDLRTSITSAFPSPILFLAGYTLLLAEDNKIKDPTITRQIGSQ